MQQTNHKLTVSLASWINNQRTNVLAFDEHDSRFSCNPPLNRSTSLPAKSDEFLVELVEHRRSKRGSSLS